ncbi:hypothetical protein [Pseudomonas frederiksbergensis]|uniref:hypothetical protein n=1 Tax=Pseudomonas frederiksbergensis TaxID=104087 RepID=UPI000F46BB01|nr:hypothetical protein [Pseudomonas frederiksbergensis]RON58869.1 hypothetical protein BK667_00675 [Pseudomonas frederiksbergensis]
MQSNYPKHSEKTLLNDFISALEQATGVTVSTISHEVPSTDGPLDAVLEVDTPDGQWRIPIQMLNEGYPRDVRNAVWALDGYRARLPQNAIGSDVVPMIVAQRLSQGARDELRIRNIGYYDASGSMYLRHERWLVNIERAHSGGREQRQISLFSGSREKVVHALLHLGDDWFTGYQLADISETSVYSVSIVLKELEKLEWVVASQGRGRDQRRKLTQPGKLLDAWSLARLKAKEKTSRWYLFCSNPKHLLTQISQAAKKANASQDWAFTGPIAANAISPLLTSVDVADIAVPPESFSGFVEALALKPAEKGSNVILIERSGAAMLFRQEEDGVWLASPFIQYIDLQNGRGRNKELAEKLRADILRI